MATPNKKPRKLKKPYASFPLTPHPNGYWVKKINGRQHRFGERWATPQDALAEYMETKDDLFLGRQVARGKLTVRDACNAFLDDRHARLESGEIVQRSFDDYRKTCLNIVEHLGRETAVEDLKPRDFTRMRTKLAERWSKVTLSNEIQRVRVCFKFLYDSGEIDAPLRFGPSFRRPSAKVLREEKNSKPAKDFTADEIRRLIDAASSSMRAMIFLGINCGFGNTDVARLKRDALDLADRWVEHPRPKTGVMRRCRLWSETCDALRIVLAERPAPKDDEAQELVFVTERGQCWEKNRNGSVGQEFGRLQDACGCRRKGVGFYALRHVFETVGGDTKDQVAVDFIMGHSRNDMASVYRTRIEDDRLIAVTDHVRTWLFG